MKCPKCGFELDKNIPWKSDKSQILFVADYFSRKCFNLDGAECQGANASDCLARINGRPCPTYSEEELEKMKKMSKQ